MSLCSSRRFCSSHICKKLDILPLLKRLDFGVEPGLIFLVPLAPRLPRMPRSPRPLLRLRSHSQPARVSSLVKYTFEPLKKHDTYIDREILIQRVSHSPGLHGRVSREVQHEVHIVIVCVFNAFVLRYAGVGPGRTR